MHRASWSLLGIVSLLTSCSPAHAGKPAFLHIPLDPGTEVTRLDVVYRCDGDEGKANRDLRSRLPAGDVEVSYLNAGENSLAVVPVTGKKLILSNVISGSGVRYAGGVYIWWSKGDTAQFADVTSPDVSVSCVEKTGPK
ncbi:MliC family protein [Swaminathania salitolerans]|uniref:MliC family protein n=1 Tax=Swaminathania salitolerans TaxID=182838 RepID=UPI0011BE2EA4|nr:MliC family protein [Swaminathania salitolerans]